MVSLTPEEPKRHLDVANQGSCRLGEEEQALCVESNGQRNTLEIRYSDLAKGVKEPFPYHARRKNCEAKWTVRSLKHEMSLEKVSYIITKVVKIIKFSEVCILN